MIKSLYLCLNVEKEDAHDIELAIIREVSNFEMEVVDDPSQADCIVTIGGDGTFLFGTRLALEHDVALAGINLGRFGFLPSFPPDDVKVMLSSLNSTEPNSRCVLDIDTSFGKFHAINEVVIERKRVQRAARITMISSPPIFGTLQQEIHADDSDSRRDFLKNQMESVIENYSVYSDDEGNKTKGSTFVCDGAIVATPLGSTAYSSSAGGPAISPYSNVMSVTLTALHHPRIPPVVLTNNENLYMRAEEECVMVCDGRHVGDVPAGEAVRVCVGTQTIKVYEKAASVVTRLAHAFGADRVL